MYSCYKIEMPPFKQPALLFDRALRTLNRCVVESCKNVQKTYGNYCDSKCQEAVQQIQDYLLARLPNYLLETMCTKAHIILNELDFPVDCRIIASVFLHKNCQKFYPQFELVPDSAFWTSKICMLKKVVVLNLKMVCTDDILEVVGTNCRSLEFINIVSRVSTLSDSTNHFNALKLKFFVSDSGLKFLTNCKKLKRITMTKFIRSQCAGSKITHRGISLLLKSLPKLEVISYSDMGSVIDEIDDVNSLSLISISDYHPVPQRILKMSSLCPNLIELCLHLPINVYQEQNSKKLGDSILLELSKSSLQLETVSLIDFPLNDGFNQYVQGKGKHLISLSLSKHISISGIVDAAMLGYYCPNVQYVHLKGVEINMAGPYMTNNKNRKSMYTNLKCLTLENSYAEVDLNVILPVFLNNAKNIACINLFNFSETVVISKTLETITKFNPFADLQKAHFFKGIFISLEFLKQFTFFCSKLKHLTVCEYALLTEKNIDDFKEDLKAKNYDITINFIPQWGGF